jgi:hypothetical protein
LRMTEDSHYLSREEDIPEVFYLLLDFPF